MNRQPGLLLVATVASVATVLQGCGSGGVAQVDDFLREAAQATCDWEFRCCRDAEIKTSEKGRFTTVEACVDYRQLDSKDLLWVERQAVGAGRMRVDGAQRAACIDRLKAQACNLSNGSQPPVNAKTVDPCSKVLVGNVGAGGECLRATDCAEGTRCDMAGAASAPGVCEPLQRENEICNRDSDCDQSSASLYCNQKDFRCHARGALGAPCAFTPDPLTGMSILPLLAPCDQTTASTYCDPGTLVCKSFPHDGEPCLPMNTLGAGNTRCDPDVRPGLTCEDNASGGTCRAPGKLGADCSHVGCDAELACDQTSKTCVVKPGAGESCQTTGVCKIGFYCDMNQMCQQKVADGSACSGSAQCLSSNCSNMACQPTMQVICSGR